jgi:hypothetical protein
LKERNLELVPQATSKLDRYLQSKENFERRALGQQTERFLRTKEFMKEWEKQWELLGL